mmetsp:Transcript_81384/g.225365  ORF Transcript_81384/g.225365 Transcript_81384/m.225365 type:complete len:383 (+) Transcript_81384:285-1433(+)
MVPALVGDANGKDGGDHHTAMADANAGTLAGPAAGATASRVPASRRRRSDLHGLVQQWRQRRATGGLRSCSGAAVYCSRAAWRNGDWRAARPIPGHTCSVSRTALRDAWATRGTSSWASPGLAAACPGLLSSEPGGPGCHAAAAAPGGRPQRAEAPDRGVASGPSGCSASTSGSCRCRPRWADRAPEVCSLGRPELLRASWWQEAGPGCHSRRRRVREPRAADARPAAAAASRGRGRRPRRNADRQPRAAEPAQHGLSADPDNAPNPGAGKGRAARASRSPEGEPRRRLLRGASLCRRARCSRQQRGWWQGTGGRTSAAAGQCSARGAVRHGPCQPPESGQVLSLEVSVGGVWRPRRGGCVPARRERCGAGRDHGPLRRACR